jgi:hypothetical protein
MVFDYILDDRAIAETVKSELARLQIVAIKAALLDRTFFARAHPMRRFLDSVAEAHPTGWRPTAVKFLTGLRGVVFPGPQFSDDLTVFTVAQETLG